MPPARTGVAAYSADVGGRRCAPTHDIDVFVDDRVRRRPRPAARRCVRSAHDFVWQHRQRPVRPDRLPARQLVGPRLHLAVPVPLSRPHRAARRPPAPRARGAAPAAAKRAGDYRAEFAANHPERRRTWPSWRSGLRQPPLLRVADDRLVVEASRVTAVHAAAVGRRRCARSRPDAAIETIRLGHGDGHRRERAAGGARRGSARATASRTTPSCSACSAALTPEKRLPQVLERVRRTARLRTVARACCSPAPPASHYDVAADIARHGLGDARRRSPATSTTTTRSPTHIAACDVSLNLRWPTAREMSGPVAARAGRRASRRSRSTSRTLADVPSLDPRTWTVEHARACAASGAEPVTVAIDILDEDHSLRLAMRRLATDAGAARAARRARPATTGSASIRSTAMLDDYDRVIARALATPGARARRCRRTCATTAPSARELLEPVRRRRRSLG